MTTSTDSRRWRRTTPSPDWRTASRVPAPSPTPSSPACAPPTVAPRWQRIRVSSTRCRGWRTPTRWSSNSPRPPPAAHSTTSSSARRSTTCPPRRSTRSTTSRPTPRSSTTRCSSNAITRSPAGSENHARRRGCTPRLNESDASRPATASTRLEIVAELGFDADDAPRRRHDHLTVADCVRRPPRLGRCQPAGVGSSCSTRQHRREQIAELARSGRGHRAPRTRARSSPSAHACTSSHVTGVDTVGRGRARSEYGAMVVLCSAFWLQSTKTLPGRCDLRHHRRHPPVELTLEDLPDRQREVRGALVRCAGGVERDVHLQALRARGLAPTGRAAPHRAPPASRARPGSTRRSRCPGPGS